MTQQPDPAVTGELPEPEQLPDGRHKRYAVVDGRNALAYVVVFPNPDEADGVIVDAAANGLSKQGAAVVLRRVADEWATPPISQPEPGSDEDQPKPEPEQAWLHPDGRIWVESGPRESRRLHLAGWAQGAPILDPQTGVDSRTVMTRLIPPMTMNALTPEDMAEFLHRITAETAVELGFASADEIPPWDQVPDDASAHVRAIATRILEALRAQFTREYGEALAEARSHAEREALKMVAVSMAAGGHWDAGLYDVITNRDHPYWSQTLVEVAELTTHGRTAVARRPDYADEADPRGHRWMNLGPGRFVCIKCPSTLRDQSLAEWPCPGALAIHPSLEHYNRQYPIGTLVWFRPNGVGDLTLSRTRTPVWIGPNDQPYVSVESYPPQAGAAVKLGDLRASAEIEIVVQTAVHPEDPR